MSREEHLKPVVALVDQLVQAGVRHLCVSPGSRSTPLTIAGARQAGLEIYTILDERSAGFFAYGLAKRSGEPVALVCTSGTAVANYLPAVIEAYFSRVPLLIITADRPAELREQGSNQTIRQTHLFSAHVKWMYELPTAEDSPILIRHARVAATRAVAVAMASPAGPVHLNYPLREPLLPPRDVDTKRVPLSFYTGVLHPAPRAIERVLGQIALAGRILIVSGPQPTTDALAVEKLAVKLRAVILADPLSGHRTSGNSEVPVLAHADVWLRADDASRDEIKPDVILRFGRAVTSKTVGQALLSWQEKPQILVDENMLWSDPQEGATDVIQANPASFCEALNSAIGDTAEVRDARLAYADQLIRLDRACQERMRERMEQLEPFFEGQIFPELARLLPDDTNLYIGNSMPIRDMDSFFPITATRLRVFANRGASGIDGVVSSAVGAAAYLREKTVLVIGDLSFFHDQNGLLAASLYHIPLVIVLVQNDGGGIFSMLSQATQQDVFPYFETPHGRDFQHTAALYGAHYTRARDWDDFRLALRDGLTRNDLTLIQIDTDRAENARLHHKVLAPPEREREEGSL
ncbi:2-succinyl-5-enolpyruvyl-6-hydroxy-3-cyclohexene-1-carboxylic-acid synthase [Ferroacidibacillus organovorans]|uniref:2-succinyl-5-enolpyruvyl-6-hydroxy-3-cyclohexene-1-carboxylate synthase n=1 Tax=Ferroacidibacillus organovorans TaxID=1765683 RepID=A0A1V4EXC5_9BACL|nr:2-succinyl-5-enolpyruvyl-6-hydroxy-3-cyclohexene-1-carboxylic-acid synthase [Ferroacidibacillus organovorans]OPG17298.1 2-succinyl-5-enolpyruvyl-6-hydroxy-3-cyclohexene-1-carboxylic-acid synthase [Ferroacidibacillus organovorans]